jgi:hypothetical protein
MSKGGNRPQIYENLAKENVRLKNSISRLQDTHEWTERLISAAAAAMPTPKRYKPAPFKKAPRQQEFHALRGDEQAGAKVTALDTNGLNEYDLDKYAEYLHTWTDKVIQFKREDEKSHGLNKLVITHLGDWLDGECIYPGQQMHIVAPIVDVMYGAVIPLEVEAMLRLACAFNSIEIYGITGNHGRAGKKGDHHWRSSFEYMLLRSLQDKLAGQDNIKMYVSESPMMVVQHGSRVFAYSHGSHLTGSYGVPYYSMDRTYKALPTLLGMLIDYYICAHRHTPVNLQDQVIMNGSFQGGTDLSVNKMMVRSRPSQKVLYVDADHGINRENNIYLAPKPKLVADKNGIFTPYFGSKGTV